MNSNLNELNKNEYNDYIEKILNIYRLSNKDSSIYLAKNIGPATEKIVLMHLSHKNNTEELSFQYQKKDILTLLKNIWKEE